MSSTSFFCFINASDSREKVTTRVWKREFDPFLDKISLNWIFSVFFAFISRYVMPIRRLCHFHYLQIQIHTSGAYHKIFFRNWTDSEL